MEASLIVVPFDEDEDGPDEADACGQPALVEGRGGGENGILGSVCKRLGAPV